MATELAKALSLNDEAEAHGLLELSPFADGHVVQLERAPARTLPFRSSAGSQAAWGSRS